MSSISVPKIKTRCSAEAAMKDFLNGETILATLTDEEDKVYAAHVFNAKYFQEDYETNLHEIARYVAEGKWYTLPKEETK